MKDVLGQDIREGARILRSGGKTRYAGFTGGVATVEKITPARLTIRYETGHTVPGIHPGDVVVVDRLIDLVEKNEP